MKKEITTKDLMALNELMTFENWIAVKLKACAGQVEDKNIKTLFKNMADEHLKNHEKLFDYLKSNATLEGGK